jgi:hypothetical protein
MVNRQNIIQVIINNKLLLFLASISVVPLLFVRFLPVYDYPHWVFQAHIVTNITNYSHWYDLNWIPVPNWGSTLPLLLLTPIFGAEFGTRVLVAVYALLLIVSFAYLARGVAGTPTGIEFVGPLLVYNYFFYNGFLSYYIGLPILLVTLGYLIRISPIVTWRELTILSTLSILAYLCHLYIWIPIFLYILMAIILHKGNGKIIISQVLPISLLCLYFMSRISEGDVSIRLYSSILNKSYSLVASILPFQRIDPFNSPVPILFINIFILLTIFIYLFWKIDPTKLSKDLIPLIATIILLLGIALFNPFSWFGGMGESDHRFMFTGYLILLSLFGSISYLGKNKWILLGLSLFIITITSIIFISVDRQLKIIQGAIEQSQPKSKVYVASFRYPPLYGECSPRFWNAGGGIFVLQWFPLYYAVENGGLDANTFNTAVVQSKLGVNYSLNFGEFQTAVERSSFINKINQNKENTYLIFFGCPKDILSVKTNLSPDYVLLSEGNYFEIFRLHETTVQ